MKKKLMIIAIAVALLVIIVAVASTWSISMVYDSDGHLIKQDSGFNISFEGSEQYTDEELANYIFGEDAAPNPIVFWWKSMFDEKVEIPFVETYDVEMNGFFDFSVTFYDKSIVGYVTYMGSNEYFDKDGVVVESSTEIVEGVPYVSGMDVDYIVLHSKLPVEDDDVFDMLLDVTQLIKKYSIQVEKINISDDMDIRLYLGDVRVDLGDGSMLNEKFIDLNDIISELQGVKGVLDMREYDSQGNGYTLKKDEE